MTKRQRRPEVKIFAEDAEYVAGGDGRGPYRTVNGQGPVTRDRLDHFSQQGHSLVVAKRRRKPSLFGFE
jgi:hypothetical protein